MTLDESIIHAEEIAATNEKLCERLHNANYGKCADEHQQLAEWLKELRRYRRSYGKKSYEKTCEHCQSDSEGVTSLDRKGRVFISPAHRILKINFKDYTGRININYCPMCGRRLDKESE